MLSFSHLHNEVHVPWLCIKVATGCTSGFGTCWCYI